ncbi:lasso peptide biosynthesis B2 protein [Cupriavidus numazuensis]|nr:lasso peptide biosynthesis B2 protein [Cupriavidus numazuensis]
MTILDELNDTYVLLDSESTQQLVAAIIGASESLPSIAIDLIADGVLERSAHHQFISTVASHDIGVGNYEWRLSSFFRNARAKLPLTTRALFLLLIIKLQIRIYGFHDCLSRMRRKKRWIQKRATARQRLDSDFAERAAKAFEIAARLVPFRTECLEFSAALFHLLLSRGLLPSFVIGIQRYDFLAHAWVELDDKVIGDAWFLPERLPAIVRI